MVAIEASLEASGVAAGEPNLGQTLAVLRELSAQWELLAGDAAAQEKLLLEVLGRHSEERLQWHKEADAAINKAHTGTYPCAALRLAGLGWALLLGLASALALGSARLCSRRASHSEGSAVHSLSPLCS